MIHELFQRGDAVEHRGILITPLFPRRDPVRSYVTLDEAISRGLVITEVDDAGSVPELAVANPLEDRVLLYDGEELLGAKQNRILNVSVLVEAKSTLRIPVSCVEQGRWTRQSMHFLASAHISHADLRRRKAETQAARPLVRGVAQSEVWDAVHEKAARMSVDSSTGASADIHRAYAHDVRVLEGAFPAQPGQCGAVLALEGVMCLDAVSQPSAFASLWPKLRAGYLLDALERLDRPPVPSQTIGSFMDGVARALQTRQPSAGLGQDLRLRGEGVVGSGLELDGEAIQLSAFRSDDGGRRAYGRIARPSRRL